jgi:hypothetical protein
VRFGIDPPDVKSLDLRLYFDEGELLQAHSDKSDGLMSITPSAQRRYAIVGTLRSQLSPQEPAHHVRIELRC